MNLLKNLLALIGLLAILAVGVVGFQLWSATRDFDPGAFEVYKEFGAKLLRSGDLAGSMVWSVQADEGMDAEEVKDAMKSLAVSKNFLFVGESPFSKQVEAVTGKPFRHVAFLNFCDVRVGQEMLEYNDAYSAFMPCTISVVEAKDGTVWLYAMNMDFLIHGARELPPELKADAIKVRHTMRDIMEGAATGEF